MVKYSKPRAGSLAYMPRKRARKETPRIHFWPDPGEARILGFAGYKVGMSNVLAIDHRKNSPTSGLEVFVPVTVLETPPLSVAAIRFYKKGYTGLQVHSDIYSDNLSEDFKRAITTLDSKKKKPDKELKELEKELDEIADIRLIVYTQPQLTSLSKKKPDLMEMHIGGAVGEKLDYAKEKLGESISLSEVFRENQCVDITAVSKGKGYQGVIKRYGVRMQPRKAGKGRRHIGSGGAWTPARKMWREPLPGQMGYHTRTENNKMLMHIGDDGSKINPGDGFPRYGTVKKEYILIKGSVPGPSKRLIRMTHPRKPKKEVTYEITHVNLSTKQK
ncbi:MAG: 50S ribosomal protein L3 [Candidatus Altiarchaeota archaeon]|nr:50S ribosomal protein L3 [Candidatus Altiarchaeota archaeon]